MTSTMPSATFGFVDREEEMSRIREALKAVKTGEGQLLIIHGEAGSGKTRMAQEAAAEAEKQGFSVGFGTALAESVVPYHPWKEVLEGLGLEAILEEPPPPKLVGFYLFSPKGHIQIKVEREGVDSDALSDLASTVAKCIRESDIQDEVAERGLTLLSQDGHRLLLQRGSTFHLGAMVEGHEDEAFLADMMALGDKAESMLNGDVHGEEDPHQAIEAHMQQLLDSEIYEGIDYSKEDPELRQSKLFEQITLGLSRKATNHPVGVIIDDLQWADPSSLAFFQYAGRNTRNANVLLLGTYRVEEVETRPHLRDALKNMEQEDLFAVMDLRGLSREDLADLADSFIGRHTLPDDFLGILWQETRGFPLFVREVLRGLEEDGAIEVRGGTKSLARRLDQLALPERVRDVIRARLNRLPEEDRQLLDAAATCGTRFTAALLANVAGDVEEEVLNGLRTIANLHGLLRSSGDGFAFDHPTVQEVLYGEMAPEERQAYHREAAKWLERAGGPIEDIGEHYYRAGDSKAAPKLNQAAKAARDRYSNDEAIRFYYKALELEEDAQKRMEMLEGLGKIYHLIGDFEKGLESFERALALAEEKRKRAEILVEVGMIQSVEGEREGSMRTFTEALDLVKNEGCKEEALALRHIGKAHFDRGDYDEAVEHYSRSLGIAEKVGDRGGVADCVNATGNVHKEWGHYDQAIACYEKSMEMKEKIDDQKDVAGMLNNIGLVHKERGDYDEALEYLNRAVGISERIGHARFPAIHLGNIGIIHLARDDNEQALEYFERSLEIRKRIGERGSMAGDLINIGVVHKGRGDYDRALDYMMKSLALLEETGLRWWVSEAYTFIAEAFLAKGDLEKAHEYCDLALSLATEMDRKKDIGFAKFLLGLVHRERKMWKESAENFEQSIGIFKDLGLKDHLGHSHCQFGLMWMEKGDLAEARQHLGRAIRIFEKIDLKKQLQLAEDAYERIQSEPLENTSGEG